MSQIFKENIPLLTKASSTTITLATTYQGKTPRISVGGRQYTFTSTITLNTATTGLNGLDTGTLAANSLYYIYAVRSTSAGFGLVASLAAPTTGPTGFTGWKEIGRFRTLVGSAAIAIVINRLIGNNLMPGASEGGPNTELTVFTATGLGALAPSVGTQSFAYRRILTGMEIKGWVKINSGLTSGSITMTIPDSFSMSTTFVDTATNVSHFGSVNYIRSGTGYGTGSIGYSSSTSIVLYSQPPAGGLAGTMWSSTVPHAWANNDEISFTALIPIAEFAGLWT